VRLFVVAPKQHEHEHRWLWFVVVVGKWLWLARLGLLVSSMKVGLDRGMDRTGDVRAVH
jgi:hypothetical protein